MSPLKDYRKPHMCRIPVLAFKNYYSRPPVLRDRFTAGSRAKREAWPGDALSCFAFSDDYSFGILQSGIHWSWFIATCSKLKGDFRYTPESVFDTFPLAAEAKARRHQSGSGGSGDVAGVATGDDEEVELLAAAASYFSSRVFCF